MTAYEEMSSLVNYIQPTKFISFEFSARMYVRRGRWGKRRQAGLRRKLPSFKSGLVSGMRGRETCPLLALRSLSINTQSRSQTCLSGSGSQHWTGELGSKWNVLECVSDRQVVMTGHLIQACLGLLEFPKVFAAPWPELY